LTRIARIGQRFPSAWPLSRLVGENQKGQIPMIGSIHVGLAALGAAIGVGLIGGAASSAVGRNPGASTKIMVQSILSIAFAEAIVFYALFLVQ
jgi:F-type H+-transporting ATPase subunit c